MMHGACVCVQRIEQVNVVSALLCIMTSYFRAPIARRKCILHCIGEEQESPLAITLG
jgi:hypothetical protein